MNRIYTRFVLSWMVIFLCCGCSEGSNGTNDTPPGETTEEGLPIFYVTGNKKDKTTAHQTGLVLAGGGTDVDAAMKWMLSRAAGGDVVVLRASGGDGYNDYFFSQLGVSVNSVTSIVIDSKDKAQKDSVYRTICRAEVLFIAGGDQGKYVEYWRDTKVHEALKYLIETKKATLGGTSAGMAVLAQICYTGENESVTSDEALRNPYHPRVTLVNNFLRHPLMASTVTDTHFSQRNRMGRLLTFMARMSKEWKLTARGIACDEKTAVCIDEKGVGIVFGGKAFFVRQTGGAPEICEANTPLSFGGLRCYEVGGNLSGANTFNLLTWEEGNGGVWRNIVVKTGNVQIE